MWSEGVSDGILSGRHSLLFMLAAPPLTGTPTNRRQRPQVQLPSGRVGCFSPLRFAGSERCTPLPVTLRTAVRCWRVVRDMADGRLPSGRSIRRVQRRLSVRRSQRSFVRADADSPHELCCGEGAQTDREVRQNLIQCRFWRGERHCFFQKNIPPRARTARLHGPRLSISTEC